MECSSTLSASTLLVFFTMKCLHQSYEHLYFSLIPIPVVGVVTAWHCRTLLCSVTVKNVYLFSTISGRILNRFSKDIGFLDDLLPHVFLEFVYVSTNLNSVQIQKLYMILMYIHDHADVTDFSPASDKKLCYHHNSCRC